MSTTTARRSIAAGLLTAGLLTGGACSRDSAAGPSATPTTSTTSTISTSATSTTSTPADLPSTTVEVRPTAAIDRLVVSGEERVHVRCAGRGDTTVVLINGFGGDSSAWSQVEPEVAQHARVCAYDRPGTGASGAAVGTSTFRSQADDLHELLQTIGESAPYLLVGQSFGGAEAVTFTSLFPSEVTGLVLVDASPATWPTELCAVADDGTAGAATVRATCSSAFSASGNSEHLDVRAAFAELARIGSLGAVPMAVITATERELPADLAASERVRLTEAWDEGQQTWLALSTAAHLVPVDRTGHHIEIDQPDVVIAEIEHLLA